MCVALKELLQLALNLDLHSNCVQMLAIPDSVEFDIPPLDLTGWQDPYAQDESAIAVDSDADDLHNDTDSSFQKRSRASSSSTSQERPIAHAAAKLKQKQQSPCVFKAVFEYCEGLTLLC